MLQSVKYSYMSGVSIMRTNLPVLIAQKAVKDKRKLNTLIVAKELGASKHTIYGMAHGTLREYPATLLDRLCVYFDCGIGDLLIPEVPPSGSSPIPVDHSLLTNPQIIQLLEGDGQTESGPILI